jgi:DNA-binding XRE family transcriptional regulator
MVERNAKARNSALSHLAPKEKTAAHADLAVSRQTVNAIETEKYDPSLPLAFKIARVFRKPVEEIFKA